MTAPMNSDQFDDDSTGSDAGSDQFFKTTIPWLTITRRAYLYRLCLALGTLFVVLGWAASDTVFGVIGAVSLALGTGTATAYTSNS